MQLPVWGFSGEVKLPFVREACFAQEMELFANSVSIWNYQNTVQKYKDIRRRSPQHCQNRIAYQLLCCTVLMFCRLIKKFFRGSEAETPENSHLNSLTSAWRQGDYLQFLTTEICKVKVIWDRIKQTERYIWIKIQCQSVCSNSCNLSTSVFLLSVALFVNMIRCVISTKQKCWSETFSCRKWMSSLRVF